MGERWEIEPTSQPKKGHILSMYHIRKPFLLILELNQNDGVKRALLRPLSQKGKNILVRDNALVRFDGLEPPTSNL